MFDKVSQAAEKLATNVSRRAFLGRLGQGALITAGVLGATLAFPGLAQADKHASHKVCTYRSSTTWPPTYSALCISCDKACPVSLRQALYSVSACTCNNDCSSCT